MVSGAYFGTGPFLTAGEVVIFDLEGAALGGGAVAPQNYLRGLVGGFECCAFSSVLWHITMLYDAIHGVCIDRRLISGDDVL